jgi:hypothetical protein
MTNVWPWRDPRTQREAREGKENQGEWLKAVDSKSTVPLWHREFESFPLRHPMACLYGEVRERLNRRAWRARGRQKCPVGSNPTLSASAGALRVLVS